MNATPPSIRRLLAVIVLTCLTALAAAAGPATMPADPGFNSDVNQGEALNDAQARDLEEHVRQVPSDGHARAELLGYYFGRQFGSAAARPLRLAHALWMIRNYPGDSFAGGPYCSFEAAIDPDGFAQARDLWKQQTEKFPDSPSVLANAAHFFRTSDPAEGEALYRRAIAADPANAKWPRELAEFLMLPSPGQGDFRANAKAAMAEFEQAAKLSSTPLEKFYLHTEMLRAGYESGDMDKTRGYADRLLTEAAQYKTDWNYGNAIYGANAALGRIELAAGNVESAKAHLLAAGKTPGSPQLDSFGPNVALARDLLAKGERQTVLDFFDLCGKFWQLGGDRLRAWSATVRGGGTPDFGANLLY